MEAPSIDTNRINDIAIHAGKKLMAHFNSAADVGRKSVPGEEEQKRVAKVFEETYGQIVAEIKKAGYGYPVLSEEKGNINHPHDKDWPTFWIIDPLDDETEYKEKHEDFAITISLIHQGFPVLGVIYLPMPELLYSAADGEALMCRENHSPKKLNLPIEGNIDKLRAVKAIGVESARVDEVLKKLQVKEVKSIGSSLKFCMVAEGKSDVFYRSGDIKEWHTAAGQAIVEMAGGTVLNAKKQRLSYRYSHPKIEEFICYGFQKPTLHWL